MSEKAYTTKRFPRSRDTIVNTLSRARKRNTVHSLLELDVTEFRRRIREKRKDERLSFKGQLLSCIAKAASEFPEVHSMRRGRKHYFFDQVDISLVLEKEIDGVKQAVPAVPRSAEKKTAAEITREIEGFKQQSIGNESLVIGSRNTSFLTRIFIFLPSVIQRFLFNFVLNRPPWAHSIMGSIMVSNLSPFTNINAWGIPLSMHPLTFLPGPIMEKALVKKGEIVVREVMNLTVTFDHEVVDGAQFGRFLKRFASLVENPQ